MGILHTYNATHLTIVDAEDQAEFTQSADHGNIGTGRFVLDDEAGTQAIIGQKDYSLTESSCSFPLTFRGFIGPREFGGEDIAPAVTTAHKTAIEVEDLNSMLGHRLIHQRTGMTAAAGGVRPAETVAARGAWLMASPFVAFVDNGRCDFPASVDMDGTTYRDAGEALSDMALACGGYNWHVNDWGSGPELTFRDDNASTADTSTLRISNVLSDASAVTLHPKKRARLRRSPANVISKQAYSYAEGTVVEELASTATSFNGERAGTVSNSNVKTPAQASAQAQAQLRALSTEDDVIECAFDNVTAAQINLILPGHRIQAKFSHLVNTGGRDYDSFTWCRVLERTVRPLVADPVYELDLKLSPQETPPTPATCASLYAETPSATYYPLGVSPTLGSTWPDVSDGVVYYWRGGLELPLVPTPGWQGRWHFPAFGAGGLGTIDYAGDCSGNHLYFMTVGNGTWTIQTETYGGVTRNLTVKQTNEADSSMVSGDSVVVTISDAVDGDCIRFVGLVDTGGSCGSKWGWSQAVWVAA